MEIYQFIKGSKFKSWYCGMCTFQSCFKGVTGQSPLGYGSQRASYGEKIYFHINNLISTVAILTNIFKMVLSVKHIL